MTETIVQYHADGLYDTARPAINVKCHAAGLDFWPEPFLSLDSISGEWGSLDDGTIYGKYEESPEARYAGYVEAAYERIVSDFWQNAEEIATQKGLGEITQEGRSGGWLVFTDGRDPQDMELCDTINSEPCTTACRAGWLAAYRSMVEWADAWIADAPRKVRDLAQQLAMDEAGERSVALRSWLAWGKEYAL